MKASDHGAANALIFLMADQKNATVFPANCVTSADVLSGEASSPTMT